MKEKFENRYYFTDSAAARLDTRCLDRSTREWNRWRKVEKGTIRSCEFEWEREGGDALPGYPR